MITKRRLGHCGGRGGGQIEDPLDDENGYQQVLQDVKNNELRREVRALRRCVARLETFKNGDSHFVDHDDDEIDNPFARAGGERRFPRRGAELLRSFGARLEIPEFNVFNCNDFVRENHWCGRGRATMKNLLLRKFYFKNFRGEADESSCTRQPIRCFKCHGFGHIQAECPNLQFITVIEFKCSPVCNEYLNDNFESVVVDDSYGKNRMGDVVRASNLDGSLIMDITRSATTYFHDEEDNKSVCPPVFDVYPDEDMESYSNNELDITYQGVVLKISDDVICSREHFGKGKEPKHVSEKGAGLSEKLLHIAQCNNFEMGSYSQVILDSGCNFRKMKPNCSINLIKVDKLLVEIFGISMKLRVADMVHKFVEARFVFLAMNRSVFKHHKKRLLSVTNFSSCFERHS
ncbi:hypothetical protein CASFOL_037116 [Castilleja foliolosa]|uniref:CCHC-type domain-containing protein n=1 Tax=Castilleja foliolosa TaxID=1961234 RepID=A0ABD3BNU9_9LAMI